MNNPALHQHAQNEAYSRSFDERCRLLELRRQQAHERGIPALKQPWQVAQGDSGQAQVIARFLLSCYNGTRFPFPLTDLRLLESALFDACLCVLRMDWQPEWDVHEYFADGGRLFEQLARHWKFEGDDDA